MNYSKEEIEFVKFCADNIVCSETGCPLFESCDEDKEICRTIPTIMEKGEELWPEHKRIIRYFMSDELWYTHTCKTARNGPECPNSELCENLENENREDICRELLHRLGLTLPDEYDILESEIQKVILNNVSSIDWDFGEEVEYYQHEPKTDVGRPDILLRGGESKTLYILEIKSGIAAREDAGQLLSYVGWYKENIPAGFRAIKGILLAEEFDLGAKCAIKASPDLQGRTFHLSIKFEKV